MTKGASGTEHDDGARAERRHKPRGVIRPETGPLRLPAAFSEGAEKRPGILPGRVVLVILVLAAAFISIITWFVAHMPPRSN
jgi:hypothetical protein